MLHLATVDLKAALAYLHKLATDGTGPDEALERLRDLRAAYPGLDLELLWEEDSWSKTFHYDLLADVAQEGSLSLSLCPEGATPWPLRGVPSRRERDLLRVNRETVDVMSVLALLDVMRDRAEVMTDLVRQCLIREAIRRRELEPSDSDVDAAVERFRRRRGLHGVEQTHDWLAKRGMTVSDLHRVLAGDVARRELRSRIVGDRTEAHFAAHRDSFDTARLARVVLRDRDEAEHLSKELRAGSINILAVAEQQFLLNGHVGTEGSLLINVRRGETLPERAEAIFAAEPGTIVGPLAGEQYYEIMQVLKIVPAKLDEKTREVIESRLFDQWLDQEREKATIEWFW